MINYDGPDRTTGTSHPRPAILTISTEFRFLRMFTDWLVARGYTRVGEVSPQDLDEYLVALLDSGKTRGTQRSMLAAVVKLWTYQPLLAEQDRLPESPPWDGERIYNLVGLRGQQDLTTPRIPPATMNTLLAWSLRFIEDLAPDITAAVREDQRLADRTRPGQGRIGRYRRESGEVTEDLRRLIRAFSRLNIPLPSKISAKTGELDYNYGYLARLIDTEAVCVKKPTSRIVLTESGLPTREGAPLLLVPAGMIDGRHWRNEPIDESEARSLVRHLMAACFVVIAYLSGMRPGEKRAKRFTRQRFPNQYRMRNLDER